MVWGDGEAIQEDLDRLGRRFSLTSIVGIDNGTEDMIRGIEHTAIAAADAASLADWYVSVLGFATNYKSANAMFVKAPDGSMIEIIHSDAERGSQTMKTQGIRHMALTVSDFDAVYSDLKNKVVNFLGEPQESKGNRWSSSPIRKVTTFTSFTGQHHWRRSHRCTG